MPGLDDAALYAKIREKAKEYNLSEQELKAIETARQKMTIHSFLGGLTVASASFLVAKQRNFKPLQKLVFTGFSFVFGSQIGLLTGAYSGYKVINSLPEPQRIFKLFQSAQSEVLNQAGKRGLSSNDMRPVQLPNQSQYSHQAQATHGDEFTPDVNDNMSGDVWAAKEPLELQNDQAHQEHSRPIIRAEIDQNNQAIQEQQPSAWDKIRSINLPNNTWNRLRMEAMKESKDTNSNSAGSDSRHLKNSNSWSRLRENPDFETSGEEVPRTREETLQRESVRKNQWGDPLG
ncbi:hypothetical protein BDF20DRAFT_911364 [Mycotypha africana]|uniref:uncharacterized protein n=1 Tax=Mycotypha africana TaxID=64632 RepID=UPI0023004476|nr:uncharacterized protein BDF20DRAFT_911364 [Mycotypha africana]KAI8984230.1 hypothetical protein BDF20DRAFT_911364 [Mycotypha africana]